MPHETNVQVIDRARKLAAKGLSLGDTPEGRNFVAKADELLKPLGMTHVDVGETPNYALKAQEFKHTPEQWAAMGRQQKWRHTDPATEAYKDGKLRE